MPAPIDAAAPYERPHDDRSHEPGLRETLLAAIFRPQRLMLLALLPAVAVLVPVLWKQWPSPTASPAYRLTAGEIVLSPPPPPTLPGNLVERTVGTAGLTAQISVLDPQLLPRVAAAFAAEPWIKQVVQVRKSLPPRVEVAVEYRLPAAVVDVKQGVYPIDAESVLLPPGDLTAVVARRYPLITGARTLPAGPPGTQWGDSVVAGAVRIAAVLAPHWEELGLTAIAAPAVATANPDPADLDYTLTCGGGSTILWGRPPGTGHPGELTAEQKLGRLKRYVADFGTLAAPGPTFEIDIRPWQEISRRPLATSSTGRRWR